MSAYSQSATKAGVVGGQEVEGICSMDWLMSIRNNRGKEWKPFFCA